jgi:hypothetical protein
LVLLAFGATYYFYQRGELAFLPQKEEKKLDESFTVQIPIADKEYKLSYKDKVDAAFDIASFEEGENWFGDGEFDYSTFLEGESSLFLTSLNGQKSSVILKKSFNAKEVLNFKFFVYLATDPEGIEEFNLIFNNGSASYRFPIRDISRGWNLLILPKEKFSQEKKEGKDLPADRQEGEKEGEIEEAVIELVSRPKTRSTVNLDSLWAEKKDDYLATWNANGEKFLSLKEHQGQVGLLASNLFGNLATLRQGAGKDYTFQAKFTPAKEGSFGFFLRGDYQSGWGYYLTINGVGTNTWQITKYGLFEEKTQILELAKGSIDNYRMEENKSYWLKAEVKGPHIIFYFSPDGQDFTRLGEAKDESFASGGVGVSINGGMVFIDEIQFYKN